MLGLLFSLALVSAPADVPWAAEVDGVKISLEEFDSYYYAHNMSLSDVDSREAVDARAKDPAERVKNPFLDRRFFLDQLIRQRLVWNRAEKEGMTAQEEFSARSGIQRDSLINAFYLKKKFRDRTQVSLQEIAEVYDGCKDRFEEVSPFAAMNYIEKSLRQKKEGEEMAILLARLREEASIVRNPDLVAKLSDADRAKRPSEGSVVSVNGKEISVKEFSALYYAYFMDQYNTPSRAEIDTYAADPVMLSSNPLLERERFLDEIISQKLVLAEAEKDAFAASGDMKALLTLQKESGSVLYYVRAKFAKELEPSSAEIETFYQENREQMAAIPADKAEFYMKQTIRGRKMTLRAQELMSELSKGSAVRRGPSFSRDDSAE